MNMPAVFRVSRFSRLGARIVFVFVTLLILVQGISGWWVARSNSQIARATIDQQLQQGERVFLQLLKQKKGSLEQGAALLSADFAFREAITKDAGTIESVLRNHGARLGANVMMLVSLQKVVIVDTQDEKRAGKPFAFPQLIDASTTDGTSSAIVPLGNRLHQLVVVPVMAPDPISFVGLAFEVDDVVARELNAVTGLEVSFLARDAGGSWRMSASTLPTELRQPLAASLSGVVGADFSGLELGGDEYETRVSRLPTLGNSEVVAVLQKPMAEGLAPFQRISTVFFGVTLSALALLVIGSLVIARSVTKPVSALAAAAQRVQGGDYTHPVKLARRDEIGQLAQSFNHMMDGIVSREREILRLAYEDILTGLPNRAMFNEQLEQAVRTARRTGHPLAALVFDMDRFKAINDTLGHPVGDLVLREVGARVRTVLRESDIVARLGGDEFGVLLATGGEEHSPRVVAMKILKALEEPLVIEGQAMDVGASIGIARYPEHGEDATALMRAADVAMYSAKRDNSGFAIYDPVHDERRQEYLTMLGELRQAVEQGELVLHYQPKLTLADNRVHAVEALVRWRHPTRGFVPPADFIPFAEQTGYISAITRWVLVHAIQQCGEWHRKGLGIRMSVNVSARDLRQEDLLVSAVSAALAEADLPAGMLCLEITESGLMDDPRSAQLTLRKLRDMGVATAIDDYGTGYSSLAYVRQLAVKELKIDRAFVSGMEADRSNAAIVRSTIDLGHNLGLTVVAEGVETEHELEELRRYGCDEIQGFHCARPMTAEAFEKWLGGADARVVAARPGALEIR